MTFFTNWSTITGSAPDSYRGCQVLVKTCPYGQSQRERENQGILIMEKIVLTTNSIKKNQDES